MKLVKVRKERNYYFAYFIESRRIIPVNYSGSQVIDFFFNKRYSPDRISKDLKISKKDIQNFLKELKKELNLPYPEGYPIINQTPTRVPIAVELQINTNCNLRCKHCFQDEYSKVMSIEKIRKILKILSRAKVFEITLVGGEIFLHPNLFEILSLCEKYNFAINIVTNGTLINDEAVKRLAKVKNLAVLVSLEGVGKINDEIRGKGVFKVVDKIIKKLKKNNVYVEISTTITSHNIDHYKEMVKYSKDLDVPCNFNLFKPFRKNHSSLIIKPERYFRLAEEIFQNWDAAKSKASLTSAPLVAKLVYNKKRDECRATITGLTIDVEGRMVPCSILQAAGFYDNVELPEFNENFIEVWNNNQYFQEFRKRGLAECQARSYIFSKNVKGKDPYGITAFNHYQKRKKAGNS